MKATLLISRELVLLGGKYVANVTVNEVGKSKKFPDGIKARFVLVNAEAGYPRLLVDNHQPYGFHMHTKLPHDKEHRVLLDVSDHNEALEVFRAEVERIIKNEKE
jgi:hypothetical protein